MDADAVENGEEACETSTLLSQVVVFVVTLLLVVGVVAVDVVKGITEEVKDSISSDSVVSL